MRKKYMKLLLSTSFCLASFFSLAQTKVITGQVKDENNAPMPGAVVMVQGTQIGMMCDNQGNYKLSLDISGMESITIQASMVGYEKVKATLVNNPEPTIQNFSLKQDQMGLKELVVTGVTNSKSKLESSVSISTIRAENINQSAPRTTAEIFRAIPGIRSEASAGDGNTNITVRGVPISSGGSKYLQLQEDGLPVLQFGDIAFATSDIFLRAD
jgi:hypothetical protein